MSGVRAKIAHSRRVRSASSTIANSKLSFQRWVYVRRSTIGLPARPAPGCSVGDAAVPAETGDLRKSIQPECRPNLAWHFREVGRHDERALLQQDGRGLRRCDPEDGAARRPCRPDPVLGVLHHQAARRR